MDLRECALDNQGVHLMKFKHRLLFVTVALTLYQPAQAQTVVFEKIDKDAVNAEHMKGSRESRLYYKLGGARPVSEPPSKSAEIKLGGTAEIGPGYSCGKFNPTASLQNFFKNLQDGLDEASNTIQNAATSAIQSLPLMIIQRNSPGLYELLQNNLFRAEEKWRLSAMSCQEMERRIAMGQNPYKKYLEHAQGEALQEEAMSNPDAVSAMKKVEQDGGDKGFYLPVPGEGVKKVGGVNQPLIKPVSSASVAGYNILIGRGDDVTNLTKPTEPHQITRTFPTPQSLADWLTNVVGEQETYTSATPSRTPNSKAPAGLTVEASKLQDDIKTQLFKILAMADTEDKNEAISNLPSTASVEVTADLLSQMSTKFNADMSALMVHNLAGELALASEIEKALIARRALMVGISEHNISTATPVREDVEQKIARLEKDIERAMFEYRLRKELVSDLATKIYDESPQASENRDLTQVGANPNFSNQ